MNVKKMKRMMKISTITILSETSSLSVRDVKTKDMLQKTDLKTQTFVEITILKKSSCAFLNLVEEKTIHLMIL